MTYPFTDKIEELEEFAKQKVSFFKVLVKKEQNHLVPLISWISTGTDVWHRITLDAWFLHWSIHNEKEAKEIIEEDFENGTIYINDQEWKTIDMLQQYHLHHHILKNVKLRYEKDVEYPYCELQFNFSNEFKISYYDFGDEIDSKIIISKNKF